MFEAGDWDIYMGVYDGNPGHFMSNIQQLTNTAGIDEHYPSWSPYCNMIAFVSDGPGPGAWDVFHMQADGSDYNGTTFYTPGSGKYITDDGNTSIEAYPIWRPLD